jgi:transposase-like protein
MPETFYPNPDPAAEATRFDLRVRFQGAVKAVIETALEEVVLELVGAGRFERNKSRKDSRNGSYSRGLLTSHGSIDLDVPRVRGGGSPATAVIGRYARRSVEIDDAILAAYVQGVSTRGMDKVSQALLGETISRSVVSRIGKQLDARVDAFRAEPIQGPIKYLFLDALYIDARWARVVESTAALVAYGVGPDGHRHLLGVTLGAEESEASWTELLDQLIGRGLAGVELVVSDAHAGIVTAVRHRLPEAKHQRCVVHFMRNVLAKVPHRLRERVGGELSKIFGADSQKRARELLEQFKAGLGRQLPEALQVLTEGFAAASRFFAFPKAHWTRIRSTNGLERLNREIRRRTDSVGAFPDRASALRLVTATSLNATAIWKARKYLDMSAAIPVELAGS